MKLPDAIAPYASLAKWLLIAALVAGVYLFGRSDGRDAQAKHDSALIEKKNDALKAAALALWKAALRFREISVVTDVAVAESRAHQKLAAELAREAGKDKTALVARIAELNAAAERERETCSQAEVQICGSPLL